MKSRSKPANVRRSHVRTAAIALVIFAALGVGGPGLASDSPSTQLRRLVDQYYEDLLRLNPLLATYNGDHRFNDRMAVAIAPDHRRRSLELEQSHLAKVEALDADALEAPDRLTRELFVLGRTQSIEAHAFPSHLLPVDQIQSMPVLLALLGSGASIQPFETAQDYDNWLGRLEAWAPWADRAIANMKQGIEAGIVLPRIVVERVMPLLDAHVVDDPRRSVFFAPLERMPSSIGAEDRERLERAYASAIREKVVPPYRRLRDFVGKTYLPRARKTVGLSDLPGGSEWYAFLVRAHTTTELTPKEIHRIGRAEVARIAAEIERVQRRDWPRGSAASSQDGPLLDGYRSLQERVARRLPALFADLPESEFEVRPVEAFRRVSAPGASYLAGAPDGSRPGVFYVNALPSTRGTPSEALFLHEAIPGHHFQISLQREREELPRFRRFGSSTAYNEGWALYVESLGEQLGLYRTRDQKLRALGSELFRARRLVVDTGLHAMGWSRERAISYLGSEREVDRYIAWPGQALAYKIGELRITELRKRAEKKLGRRFDIRKFHEVVLREGAMPLEVLERRVEEWIGETRTAEQS